MTDSRQWLEVQRETCIDRRNVVAHPDDCTLGVTEGACPGCGAEPFLIRASSPQIHAAQTLRGNGHAVCCGDPVGYVYATKDTLFGLEEDRAMLNKDHQRARVYW